MIAMLIGLIGCIVIFQVLAVSERQKRTTTGAGDAQQNGLLGLYAIERDARMAGYGFNYVPLLGCNVLGYDSNGARDFSFPLLPVRITDGAAGAPDSISFVYGSSALLVVPAKLTQTSGLTGTENKVANRFGFQIGEVMLIGEPGKDCTLRQVTSLPTAVGATDQVHHTTPARYNKPNGLPVSYTVWDNTTQTGGRLFGLGLAPVAGTYSVQNGELTFLNLLTDTTAVSVTDSIVQLQAEYGKDMNGDGRVDPAGAGGDVWEATMPVGATATDWSRVLAVRIAVVARSAQPEALRPGQTACDVTTAPPTWKNGTTPISVASDPNWQCYRYRVFETTVPLRNLIWVAL